MPLRPATFADLLPASKAMAAAFKDEELFGGVLHPHRQQYPDDMYLFFLRLLRVMYYSSPDNYIILYTTTHPQTGEKDAIAGAALWTRKRAVKQKPTLPNQAMATAMESYNAAEALIYPNRAADPSMADVLDRMEPFTAHHWTGTRAESWYLNLLGVDPAFGGKGAGRELVAWGFERAREEGMGVGCSVIVAVGKEKFYERCGFDVTVGRAGDEGGEANPLRDVRGGAIMFWDGGRAAEGVKRYGEV